MIGLDRDDSGNGEIATSYSNGCILFNRGRTPARPRFPCDSLGRRKRLGETVAILANCGCENRGNDRMMKMGEKNRKICWVGSKHSKVCEVGGEGGSKLVKRIMIP